MESKELKEIVKKIRTFIARYPLQDPFDMMDRKAFADNIAAEFEAYGNTRFNEALDKVKAGFCSGKSELHNILSEAVESLKIPTS